MMTFREALEKEITSQGISVAEVAEKSRVSKGTIYNILNGTTEAARIRVATRRAIAQGCDRDLLMTPDGGIVFVAPQIDEGRETSSEVGIRFLAWRPFFSDAHAADAFDWLYTAEENGALSGLQIVDRVFQRREDFVGVEFQNTSDHTISQIRFDLQVVYDGGISGSVACQFASPIAPGKRIEYTLFVMVGPAFDLTLVNAFFVDASGQTINIAPAPTFRFEGE